MLVKCEFCGSEFNKSQAEINRTKKHYCSKQCFRNAKENSVAVKCEQCGTEFKKTKANYDRDARHFCSNECKFKNNNKRLELKCKTCGKIHFKPKNQVERSEHHFCSKECALKYQDKRIEKTCPYCNTKFLVSPSTQGRRKFCSETCKFEDMKIRETSKRKRITCDNCGAELLRNITKVKANKFNFCSYECMGEFKRNDDYSEDYYDSKEWKTLRLSALLRDEQKCCECGDGDSKLVVHHKTPRSKGGKDELTNLITLCNTCHIKQHLKDLQEGSENIKIQNFYRKTLRGGK